MPLLKYTGDRPTVRFDQVAEVLAEQRRETFESQQAKHVLQTGVERSPGFRREARQATMDTTTA